MTIDDIKALIAKGEPRTLELKKTIGEQRRVYKVESTTSRMPVSMYEEWLKLSNPLSASSPVEEYFTPSISAFSHDAAGSAHDGDATSAVEGNFLPSPDDIGMQQKILEYCREPRGIAEISGMLGLSSLRWVRDRYITPLIGTKLRRTLPDKPRSKNQKYQTIE